MGLGFENQWWVMWRGEEEEWYPVELLYHIRQNIQPAGAHLLQPPTLWQKGEMKEGVSQNLLQRCSSSSSARTVSSGWESSSEAGPGAVGAASFVMASGFCSCLSTHFSIITILSCGLRQFLVLFWWSVASVSSCRSLHSASDVPQLVLSC